MEIIHLSAKGARISYFFALTSKYTFIRGKSGTGKTTLLNLIEDNAHHVDHNYKLIPLSNLEEIGYLTLESYKNNPKILFYADEDYNYMHHMSFQKLMQEVEGLFLIVDRYPFSSLSYAASDIVTIASTFKHEVTKPYVQSNFPIDYTKIKNVIVEDSGSGLSFFRTIFPKAQTSNGKNNIRKLMLEVSSTLFIVDAIGAGSNIKEIYTALMDNAQLNNQLLLIDSFEAMVLKSKFLEAWVDPPINCSNKEEYATQLLIDVLSKVGVYYSKSDKNPCLTDDCCYRDSHCSCRKYGNKLQLVAGEIYDGLRATSTKTDNEICLEVIKLPDTETQSILQLASQFSATFKSANKSIDFNNPLSIQMHCQMLTSL